jgi:hypothetical protein
MLTIPLDRLAIRLGCASVRGSPCGPSRRAEAEALLNDPALFDPQFESPPELRFLNDRAFQFVSPLASPWKVNNIVPGKLDRCGPVWQNKPTVILLHGWNGEWGYDWQFPYLAWRLKRAGLNTAMLELPYHGQRRPREPRAIHNFISHDLVCVVEAMRQSLADVRALIAWLSAQGSPGVGLWGISLGAWLAGWICCLEAQTSFAVLMSPVADVPRAIEELPFCEAIRHSLGPNRLSLRTLSLSARRPSPGPARVLILQSQHDLFAPVQTIEALWAAWGQPEMWRLPHGHISVLLSLPVLERTVRWIARTAKQTVVSQHGRQGDLSAVSAEQEFARFPQGPA